MAYGGAVREAARTRKCVVMAHAGELVAKMEWLLQEVDKKNEELVRKNAEIELVRQETARLQSATEQDGGSGHLATQVHVSRSLTTEEKAELT